MQHEGTALGHIDAFHQVGRPIKRIDDFGSVIAEHQEGVTQANVDTGRLHLLRLQRFDHQGSLGEQGPDGAIGQNHAREPTR